MAGKRSARKGQPKGRQHLAFAGVGLVTQIRCQVDDERLVVAVETVRDQTVRVLRCPTCDWRQAVPAAVEMALAGGEPLPGLEDDDMASSSATASAVADPASRRSARNVTPRPGESAGELTLPTASLIPSPLNPRKRFDQQALAELAASLRDVGMLQPVVVRPIPAGQAGHGAYWIVAGERRWRAAQLAGLTYVPVRILEDLDDAGHLRLAITENDARKDLDPVEQARAYRQLSELTGQTQAQIGASIGRAPSTIANALRLLDLPEDVLGRISAGELSPSHGKALARFAGYGAVASKLGEWAAKGGWTSKAIEGGLPNAVISQLASEKLGQKLDYAVGFDTNVCKASCPFGAYIAPAESWAPGLCLRPAHMQELQAEYKAKQAAEQQKIRETTAAAVAGADGPLKLADLAHGTYQSLRYARPAGCTSACPCERTGLDGAGQPLPICVDPARYAERERESKRADIQRRTDLARVAEEKLTAELLADQGVSRRALAMLAAVVLDEVRSGLDIRVSAERYAPALAPYCRGGDASRGDWQQPERLFALAGVEPGALVRFLADAHGRQQIVSMTGQYAWSGEGALVKWFAGIAEERAADADADSTSEDATDAYPRESEVYCDRCDEPITVRDEEEDRRLAAAFTAAQAGALVGLVCPTCADEGEAEDGGEVESLPVAARGSGMTEQTRCRSCNEPITWGQTEGGKRAPFNVSDGQNHFVTCPQRREWRKAEKPVQASFLGADDAAPQPTAGRRPWEA